jgi:hypothetical protein
MMWNKEDRSLHGVFWLGISKQATIARDQRVISASASTTALFGAVLSKYFTMRFGSVAS